MDVQRKLDEVYSHIMTNYEENECCKALDLIDELQNEIDSFKNN